MVRNFEAASGTDGVQIFTSPYVKELETNLREVLSFIINVEALTRAFSWLKVPSILALSHLKHYAKQALTHNKNLC